MLIVWRPGSKPGVTLCSAERCEYRNEEDPTDDSERKCRWNLDEMPHQHFCSHEDQYCCQARRQVTKFRGDSGEEEV